MVQYVSIQLSIEISSLCPWNIVVNSLKTDISLLSLVYVGGVDILYSFAPRFITVEAQTLVSKYLGREEKTRAWLCKDYRTEYRRLHEYSTYSTEYST